jgi:hypothetical protein
MTNSWPKHLLLQVISRANAGQPGADDQDVEMFDLFGRFHGPPNLFVVMAGLRPGHPRLCLT